MGGEPVPPDWPPLTTAEVRRLLSRLGHHGASSARVRWRSPRPFSSAALVAVPGGRLLIKRHSAQVRSVASLEAEHDFMSHLATRDLPVPAVLADGTASAWQDGDFVYEVQRALAGRDLYAEAPSWTPFRSAAHAAAAGATLARLHIASVGYEVPARPLAPLHASQRVISSPDPVAAVTALADEMPGLSGYLATRRGHEYQLARAFEPFHHWFFPHAGLLGELWAHNDWHPSNLMWSSTTSAAGVAGIIDFGLANRTNACYDLATALERTAIGWLSPEPCLTVQPTLAKELLRGYWKSRPLSPPEASALPRLVPLVHVEYALSEIDYFWRVVRSPANADLAYDGYLLGHLRWFAGGEGQRFCSFLAHVVEELAEGTID